MCAPKLEVAVCEATSQGYAGSLSKAQPPTRCASCCCVSVLVQGIYLVADDADSADAWVDALVLCQHLVGAQCSDALEEALAPLPARRSKHAAGMAS
jgi:hypothetical protein